MIKMINMKRIIKVIKVKELINILLSIRIKFCTDDKKC